MYKQIDIHNAQLLPGLFRERAQINRDYLMELDCQCLLQNFYLEAGIVMPGLQVVDDPSTANLHWGWEAPSCQLRGHFLGHWMSAAAMYAASERDGQLKAKLEYVIGELARCQALNGGKWIGSIPEKYFWKLETDSYIWSPQYVMHKTLMGLLHAYLYIGSRQALEIFSAAADWYLDWTAKMQQVNPHAVYSGEEGGMLEIWATAYQLTGDERYLTLARRYSQPSLFRRLLEGEDPLTNCHANASIPWAHGAAKMYEVTGEEIWKTVVLKFWDCAVHQRESYCTGGQNAGEYWVPQRMLGRFLTDRNQEFCTVYNMVRVADWLLRQTGDAEYADYIEKNLYNGFLAQQNKYTAMPTYFLPMKAGSRKKWGSKRHDFWCCHGTMVQSQTLYPALAFYRLEGGLAISQYIPCRYEDTISGHSLTVSQNADMKYYNDQAFFDEHDDSQMSRWQLKVEVQTDYPGEYTLALRLPGWVKDKPVLTVNGEAVEPAVTDGWIRLRRVWKQDTVRLYLPPRLQLHPLPDNAALCALSEGPIVLAGLTQADRGLNMPGREPGVAVTSVTEHTYSTFPWLQSCYRTVGQAENFDLVPLYDVTDETYTLYFTVQE